MAAEKKLIVVVVNGPDDIVRMFCKTLNCYIFIEKALFSLKTFRK